MSDNDNSTIGKLQAILQSTTQMLRKGEEVETKRQGPLEVVDVYMMPHESDPKFNTPEWTKVDVIFMYVAINRKQADRHKEEFAYLLDRFPEDLAKGPSYIETGGDLGSQDAALCMYALGSYLGLWNIITPLDLGAKDEKAKELAGAGWIMITGYKGSRGATVGTKN